MDHIMYTASQSISEINNVLSNKSSLSVQISNSIVITVNDSVTYARKF